MSESQRVEEMGVPAVFIRAYHVSEEADADIDERLGKNLVSLRFLRSELLSRKWTAFKWKVKDILNSFSLT